MSWMIKLDICLSFLYNSRDGLFPRYTLLRKIYLLRPRIKRISLSQSIELYFIILATVGLFVNYKHSYH